MADAFDRNRLAVNIEQYAPVADAEAVFRGIIGQPLHVAREVVGQPVDLRSDPPRDIG